MKFIPPINPKAVFHMDNVYIGYPVDENTFQIVEGALGIERAIKACKVLNSHEERNNRPQKYVYIEKPL